MRLTSGSVFVNIFELLSKTPKGFRGFSDTLSVAGVVAGEDV
jgi:hypothetical protein